jgi:hypothetical protein
MSPQIVPIWTQADAAQAWADAQGHETVLAEVTE